MVRELDLSLTQLKLLHVPDRAPESTAPWTSLADQLTLSLGASSRTEEPRR